MKIVYLVKSCKNEIDMEVLGTIQKIPVSWWDGMVGAVPIFDNYENALEYCDGDETLIESMNIEEKNEFGKNTTKDKSRRLLYNKKRNKRMC